MKDPFYNSNNLDIIVLCLIAVNIYCIKGTKKDLRCSEWITRLMAKIIKVVEASAVYIITCML